MARCNDCNKFVSYDEDTEPEVDGGSFTDNEYNGDVSRVLNCADCGSELRRGTFSLQHDLTDALAEDERECPGHEGDDEPEDRDDKDADDTAHEWEIVDETAENNDRTVTTDRHGRQIKKARYFTTMRGVTLTVQAKCGRCGLEKEFVMQDEMAASSMDES